MQQVGRRPGGKYVARLHRQEVLGRGNVQRALQRRNIVHKLGWRARADIYHAAGCCKGQAVRLRGSPGCLNRLAIWISGSPLVDHAAARSGWSKYTWSGVLAPRAECSRTLL